MNRAFTLTLFTALSAGFLAGCNTTTDDKDTSGATIHLEPEQRAALAARASAGQFMNMSEMARTQATAAAENPDPRSGNTAGTTGRSGPQVDCGTTGNIIDDGNIFKVSDLSWESQFTNKTGFPDSNFDSEDLRIRANCRVVDDNDNPVSKLEGAFNLLHKTDVDNTGGHLIHATAGGLTGNPLNLAAPDLSEHFRFDTFLPDANLSFKMRFDLQQCAGCVGGDLGDWNGEASRDMTSTSFLEMDMTINGRRNKIQAGERDNPFVYTMKPSSVLVGDPDSVDVSMDGRMQYSEVCSYDVTLETIQDLAFSDMDSDPEPQSGTLNVTDNDSGEEFKVKFSGGKATVYNSNGAEVTVDSNRIDQCDTDNDDTGGESGNGNGSGGGYGAPSELIGTWTTNECLNTDSEAYTHYQPSYIFLNSLVTIINTPYETSACSTKHEDVDEVTMQYDYTLSDSDLSTPTEIDFFDGKDDDDVDVPNRYDLIKVDGNELYFGNPALLDQANSKGSRPNSVDSSWHYSRFGLGTP